MNKTLIVRYGEIYLKGKNKSYFESSLVHNIKIALYGINYSILRAQNRIVIEKYSEKDEPKIMDILKRVFGIHSISPALEIKTDFDEIIKNSVLLSNDTGTFRVTERAAREGCNPQTKQKIIIPATKTPSFSAGAELKKSVNS